MYIITQSENKKISLDIATTRLFSVHAYLVSGSGSLAVSQSNFNKPDRFEVIQTIQLLTTNDSARNAIVSVKDAPCKYFQVELVDPTADCVIEVEILFK